MRAFGVVFSILAVGSVLVGTQACSLFSDNAASTEDRICTPGNYVFCRCKDRTEGTKLCKDGTSFEACTTNDSGECAGGEIDDPRTGEDVEPPPSAQDGGKVNSIEACPGKSTAVSPNAELKIEGDTTNATDDAKGKEGACASGAGGNDHVYRLIPSGSGQLDVKVEGAAGMTPVVYLRTTCEDVAAQSACGPANGAVAQIKTNVVNGREYYLFVDGASESAGKYTVTAKLTTGSFCGDGQVDTNEACDDANKTEDDGCSNDCRKANGNPASAGGCPGQPVHVWPGQTVSAAGSTIDFVNQFDKPSNACALDVGTNLGPEHVYEVTPHASGTLQVALTPQAGINLMVYSRSTCGDANTMTGCANDGTGGGAETLNVAVTKDQKIYVVVDAGGNTNNKGSYTATFKIQ